MGIDAVRTANVTVILKEPVPPAVKVDPSNIKARSTSVTWPSSPGLHEDELSIDEYTLQYQNDSFNDNITLPGGLSRKDLINLKPYTSYSVRMRAKSALGKGLWSGLVNFETKTAVPEVTVQFVNVTGLNSQSIYVRWQKPDFKKLNGPFKGYIISYKEAGKTAVTVSLSGSSTSWTLISLKKYTKYFIKIAVTNRDHSGPWSNEKEAWTKQDAPSEPQNLQLQVLGPSGNARPRMTVSWGKPANENGIITKYTLVYTYTLKGKVTTTRYTTNSGNILSYSFDVLGGIQYTVNLWAETIKPGPKATNAKLVPVYAPSIAPPNITSKKINEKTYRISWDPLPREISNGDVIAYEVNQTMVSSLCTARAISSSAIVLVNTTDTFTVLSGLKACSQYNVQVRAYTTAGPGVFGIPRRIATTVPLAPNSLSASSPQSTILTLNWKKPSLNSELVEKYQILFNGTKSYFKGFKDSREIDTSGPVLSYKVDTLLPGTEYIFAVRAKSSCGISDVGNGVVVETMVDYPRSPNVSVVEKISTPNTSISVTIWGVEPYNGPISHYQVIVQRVNNWADEIPEKNNKKKLLDYDESQEEKQGYYIAAELKSELIHPSLTFDIGDGKRYGTYKNVALPKSQKYKIYIRAVTTAPKYLPGRETLTAMVTVMEGEHGANEQKNSSCDKPSNKVLVISNIILGVAFAFSLGVNVYLWRVRRTPKTGERYSPKEIQVDAPQNEQGDAGIQAPQQTSDYMELRTTQTQLTSNTSEYRSLTRNRENDTESKQTYANADFHQLPKANENEIYENMNT